MDYGITLARTRHGRNYGANEMSHRPSRSHGGRQFWRAAAAHLDRPRRRVEPASRGSTLLPRWAASQRTAMALPARRCTPRPGRGRSPTYLTKVAGPRALATATHLIVSQRPALWRTNRAAAFAAADTPIKFSSMWFRLHSDNAALIEVSIVFNGRYALLLLSMLACCERSSALRTNTEKTRCIWRQKQCATRYAP